jgi:hypothetical protein
MGSSIMTNTYQPDLSMLEYIMHANQKKGIHKIYLFLDFDGVINVFYKEGTKEYEKKIKESLDHFDFADRDCVKRLDQFCQDYPVNVIISSSWRFGRLQSCKEYLVHAGLHHSKCITDTTQTKIFQSREKDIEEYLLAHPDFSGFLIFDDMMMPHLKDYLVQTDSFHGWDAERDTFARTLAKKF